ncbi:Repressible alkaline phosphatase [Spathaspora sp. JA1]|nr:Repressible alkaline phosphatase [Spathaspora sp. JA1]
MNEVTGVLEAVINANTLTAFRTALASTLGLTKVIDVNGSGILPELTVFGVGAQAYWHIKLALVLYEGKLSTVNILNRTLKNAQNLQEKLSAEFQNIKFNSYSYEHEPHEFIPHVQNSSIIFGCTPATVPIIKQSYLNNDKSTPKFISLIGSYKPHMIELDLELCKRLKADGISIIVDSKEHTLHEAGELIQAGYSADQLIEIQQLYQQQIGNTKITDNSTNLTKVYLSYFLNVLTLSLLAYVYLIPSSSNDNKNHHFGDTEPAVDQSKKKNIIMMVTDGMGPASMSAARSFRQFRDQLAINDILTLDKYLIGSSRTRSSSSLVTDSAAGATAFSCALKSYNGAIGVKPDSSPCGTILEALKLQGYMTGLVVTTRITDATPAAFSSHVDFRSQEDLIAQHQIGEYPLGRMVDLILGGGRCHFYPSGTGGGCRADGRNLIDEVQRNGTWSYVGDRASFDQLDNGNNVTLPLLGLLADTDIPYDIDRDSKKHPSLAEQVKVALTALSKATENSEQGFFLLIEGSRIDHAGHHNDPAAQVREVLAYDAAFAEVIKFIDESDVDTVAISTSDHETGGLVTARQVTEEYPDYLWYPEILANSKHSGDFLAHKIANSKISDKKKLIKFVTKEILENDMGIKDYTEDEIKSILDNATNPAKLLYVLNDILSFRAQIGWTTHGHSAVDVNIYAYTNSERLNDRLHSKKPYVGLAGNHENIEIGAFMESISTADLGKVTELIQDTQHSPKKKDALTIDEFHANVIQA